MEHYVNGKRTCYLGARTVFNGNDEARKLTGTEPKPSRASARRTTVAIASYHPRRQSTNTGVIAAVRRGQIFRRPPRMDFRSLNRSRFRRATRGSMR